jgi:hypothetical protein
MTVITKLVTAVDSGYGNKKQKKRSPQILQRANFYNNETLYLTSTGLKNKNESIYNV